MLGFVAKSEELEPSQASVGGKLPGQRHSINLGIGKNVWSGVDFLFFFLAPHTIFTKKCDVNPSRVGSQVNHD